MTSLFVIAHPDDEVYGCGGTISQAENAVVLCLCRGDKHGNNAKAANRTKAFRHNMMRFQACPLYGGFNDFSLPGHYQEVIKEITEAVNRFKPSVVYTHSVSDIHVDHRVVAEATLVACRPTPQSTVKALHMFETVSSTDWGFGVIKNQFKPNHYIDITQSIDDKIAAATKYSNEEIRQHPDCRSIQAIQNLAAYRGQQVGVQYAEAFETVFSIA